MPPGSNAFAYESETIRSASGLRVSIARTKALLLELLGRPLEEALDLAAEQNAQARLGEDCQRGIAHFLATKQSPSWR